MNPTMTRADRAAAIQNGLPKIYTAPADDDTTQRINEMLDDLLALASSTGNATIVLQIAQAANARAIQMLAGR